MTRAIAALLLSAILTIPAAPALADSPEQLEQLEPERGQWQAELHSRFSGSKSEGGQHSLELFRGLSEVLALGLEVEAGWDHGSLQVDEVGAIALARFTDAREDALGAGLMVGAAVGTDGRVSEIEARAIAEKITQEWWAQGNVIWRGSREDGDRSEMLAYAWSASRWIAQGLWIGLEGSGRIAGSAEPGHYAGSALAFELELGGREVEVGAAYLRRFGGEASAGTGRAFVQLGF